jgi:S-DNA-T family DNA segregation ATPase FtsK/SpoIIIE
MINFKKYLPKIDKEGYLSISAIGFFALALTIYISTLTLGGESGSSMDRFLRIFFGRGVVLLAFLLVIAGMFIVTIQRYPERLKEFTLRIGWGIGIMFWGILGLFNAIWDIQNSVKISDLDDGGGIIGGIIYPFIFGSFGWIIGIVISISIFLAGFFCFSEKTIYQFADIIQVSFKNPHKIIDLIPDLFQWWHAYSTPPTEAEIKASLEIKEKKALDELKAKEEKEKLDALELERKRIMGEAKVRVEPDNLLREAKELLTKLAEDQNTQINPELLDLVENITTKTVIEKEAATDRIKEILRSTGVIKGHWTLPSTDILTGTTGIADAGDIEGNKNLIQSTLGSFGVNVEMREVTVGPTLTQYTLKPDIGVKVASITNYQSDLAMHLAAKSIRIQAPIPGQSLVGVEIPNKKKSAVMLRNLLESNEFLDFEDDLPVVVGVDVSGKNLVRSLAKTPHLLVAGATGSGKSVWINSMLLSLLYKYSPNQLELILVDMKRVELKLYEKTPHLLTDVITDADKAINALKWALLEMERRYKLLEQFGKRNIVDFNSMVTALKDNPIVNSFEKDKDKISKEQYEILAGLEAAKDRVPDKLSYIVFVIDELGDLMMTSKQEVEPIIVRLTQMSRAVGIHLVLGTQRPDTKVITGLIKANIPTRLAFAVVSSVDSRVILDRGGAEQLLGQGDGMISSGGVVATRFQGCFVEEQEVRMVVEYWKNQVILNPSLKSNLNNTIVEATKSKINIPGMPDFGDEVEGEDLYSQIKKFVIFESQASTSMLQTTFGIGYPKARKMIDQLCREGIVGPPNGSKAREVLVSEDYED